MKAEAKLKPEGKTGEGDTDVEATPVEPGAAVAPPTQLETGALVPASSDIFEMEKGSPLSLAIFFGKAAMVRDVEQRLYSVLRRHGLLTYITPLQIRRRIEMSSSPLRAFPSYSSSNPGTSRSNTLQKCVWTAT